MPESARSLWKLIVACEVLSRDAARRLVEEYGEAGLRLDAAATDVAQRLISDGHVSRYHVEHLLRGQRRRFRYGAYLVWEPITSGRFTGLYRARRDDDATCYLMYRGEKADAEADGLDDQRTRWRKLATDGSAAGLYPIVDEIVVAERVIVVLSENSGQTLSEAVAAGSLEGSDAVGRAGLEIATALSRLEQAGIAYGVLGEDNVWCDDEGQDGGSGLRLLGPPLVQLAESTSDDARHEAWQHDAHALADWLRRGFGGGQHRAVLRRVVAGLRGTDGEEPLRSADEVVAALTAFGDDASTERDTAEASDAFPAIHVGDTSMSARVKTRGRVGAAPARRGKTARRDDVTDATDGTIGGRSRPAAWPMAAAAASTLLAVVVVGWWLLRMLSPWTLVAGNDSRTSVREQSEASADQAGDNRAGATAGNSAADDRVARRDQLWRSPTEGEPMDLAYLPVGVQAIVAVRGAELASSAEGGRIIETLGPWARSVADDVIGRCGAALSDIEQLVVAFRDAGGTQPEMIVVVRLVEPRDQSDWLSEWQSAGEGEISGQRVYVRDELCLWFPVGDSESTSRRVAVIAGAGTLGEIVESGSAVESHSRQLAALVTQSDADRAITILSTPSFLQSGGRDLFSDEAETLRELIDLWFRDEAAAFLVSFDTDEQFFSEIRVYPASGVMPDTLARRLQAELSASPGQLRDYVERLELSDYGRRIVMRLPRMVEAWTEFVRFGIEDRQVVFRSYLPAAAAHNLALGGQIVLQEQPGEAIEVVVNTDTTGIAERLDRVMSLTVPRESLHATLGMLGDELGVEVEIIGGDLEAVGITRNQSISLDARELTGKAILATILRSADSEGRLVYVVHEADEDESAGDGKIVIATRAAAERRGDVIAGPSDSEIE